MKPLHFDIKAKNMRYVGTLYHKYSALLGDSATGKSLLIRDVLTPSTDTGDLNVEVFNLAAFKKGAYHDVNDCQLLILDEDATLLIANNGKTADIIDDTNTNNNFHEIQDAGSDKQKTLLELLKEIPCHVLIIDRENFCTIPMNFKAFYVWEHTELHLNTLTRQFPDFDVLNVNKLKFVCEDSKAGFAYFARYLQDVSTASGVSNIKNVCAGKHVIADGAGVGPYLRKILEITNDVYLPESFEYLCFCALNPTSNLINDYLEEMPAEYLSTELFFKDKLIESLSRYCISYKKSECPHNILMRELVPGLDRLSPWGEYCDTHNIVNTAKALTYLLAKYSVTGTEELMKCINTVSIINEYFEKYQIAPEDKPREVRRLRDLYGAKNIEELEKYIKEDLL